MKWVDELTPKEHFSFLDAIERDTTEFEDVLSAYEGALIFEEIRKIPDSELLALGDGDGLTATIAKVFELRLRAAGAASEEPEDRKWSAEKFRAQFNFILGSLKNVGGDYIGYMAYCEYVSLRKEGQTDASNSSWEEWQDTVLIKHVLDSFYSRVADERLEHWTETLLVEETNAARREPPAEPGERREDKEPVPLENASESSD